MKVCSKFYFIFLFSSKMTITRLHRFPKVLGKCPSKTKTTIYQSMEHTKVGSIIIIIIIKFKNLMDPQIASMSLLLRKVGLDW